MGKIRNKFIPYLRQLTLAVLLICLLICSAIPVSADDPIITFPGDHSGIKFTGTGVLTLPEFSAIGGSGGGFLFEQPPITPANEFWVAWTSDKSAGYLCMDDFWGLTDPADEIYWYGGAGIFDREEEEWLIGSPYDMQFEIKFYEDNGGSPGATAAVFSDVRPSFSTYDMFDGFQVYRFRAHGLNVPPALTEGWVSIQSTWGRDGSVFLWLVSNTGNLNARQNDAPIFIEELGQMNLAFALKKWVRPPTGIGGEVQMVNKPVLIILLLALVLVTTALGVVFSWSRRKVY